VWFMSLCMDKRSLSLLGFTLDGAFFVDSIIGLAVGITIVSRLGGRAVFGIPRKVDTSSATKIERNCLLPIFLKGSLCLSLSLPLSLPRSLPPRPLLWACNIHYTLIPTHGHNWRFFFTGWFAWSDANLVSGLFSRREVMTASGQWFRSC
jgi:hypothetical protein